MKLPIYQTRLVYGLPAVLLDGKWVVVSPYARELTSLAPEQIDSPQVRKELADLGFFGQPASGPGALSDYFQLTLITTSGCNLCCGYCFANSGETMEVMSEAVALAAVRHAVEKASGRNLLISFFGGEPSLTPDLIKQVVAYAKEQIAGSNVKGVRFNITTNGVIVPALLDFLIAEDFFLTISMDGIPQVQDHQRPLKNGGLSSPLVERTIKTLVERGRKFMVRATVTDYSVAYLVPSVKYLHSLGVKNFHIEPINLAGRAILRTKAKPMSRPKPQDFIEHLASAIIRAGELGMEILNSSFMNLFQPSVHFCDGIGGNRVSVSYTGEVTTCLEVQSGCHPTADYFIVGKYDPESGEIVIDQTKRQRICDTPITSQNECCKNCFAIHVCGGGCPIRNYHMTGDKDQIDPFRCQVIRAILPFVIALFNQAAEE